jgi:hypothetical protein
LCHTCMNDLMNFIAVLAGKVTPYISECALILYETNLFCSDVQRKYKTEYLKSPKSMLITHNKLTNSMEWSPS